MGDICDPKCCEYLAEPDLGDDRHEHLLRVYIVSCLLPSICTALSCGSQ